MKAAIASILVLLCSMDCGAAADSDIASRNAFREVVSKHLIVKKFGRENPGAVSGQLYHLAIIEVLQNPIFRSRLRTSDIQLLEALPTHEDRRFVEKDVADLAREMDESRIEKEFSMLEHYESNVELLSAEAREAINGVLKQFAAAVPDGSDFDDQVAQFDYQNASVAARGTINFVNESDPPDGIGEYGGAMEVEFIPSVVFKGSIEPLKIYSVDIPNAFLSYQSTYMSRDQAYMRRQELLQESLDVFSANYSRVAEAHEQGLISAEEFSTFSEISDVVARDISRLKPSRTIHVSPARPKEEVAIQKIVFDGSMYTLFLTEPSPGTGNKLALSVRGRSIFGGLENYYVQKAIKDASEDP